MKIIKSVYKHILNSMPVSPPEIGGILGSIADVVCKYQIDTGLPKGCGCFYSPNVCFLNNTINDWQQEEIIFQGIFHTHFFGVQTLSDGDVAYITSIMQAMPECISKLYFPIVVLPEKEMISYLAIRSGNAVEIKKDELIIV